MNTKNENLINEIAKKQEHIYSELYNKFSDTTMATSSESLEHKKLRFSIIAETFQNDDNFSIHDVGMGLAQFYEFLKYKYSEKNIKYSGTEIVKEYYYYACKKYPDCDFYLRNLAEFPISEIYDYVIMSGVFHQIRDTKRKDWELFMQSLLKNSFNGANKALVFNVISPFVDFYQTQVYYCNLSKLLNFINDNLSRFWTIKSNYPLFEMTISVYNPYYIKSLYQQNEFRKYFGEE